MTDTTDSTDTPQPNAPTIPGLPPLRWIGEGGRGTFTGGELTMAAGPNTDWFNDPADSTRLASAPALVFDTSDDCQLSAMVTVGFNSTFDAGVLFAHQSGDDFAKLCFEYSPDLDPMVVSVVTRETSDDANGPVVAGRSVYLRVSRVGETLAFHHSVDGDWWRLTRLFKLRDAGQPTALGFLAQSPTGDGCVARFSEISLTETTLGDPRDGF